MKKSPKNLRRLGSIYRDLTDEYENGSHFASLTYTDIYPRKFII